MDTKLCVVCGEDLPLLRRSDRRYCGVGCRVRAHKIRGNCQPAQRQPIQDRNHSGAAILGITATAVAVEAIYRDLAQEREQRQKDREELERERQTVAELRAEVQRMSAEQADEPQRLSAALDEERQRLHADFNAEKEQLQQANSQRKLLAEKEASTRQELEHASARCKWLAVKRRVLRKRLAASREQSLQLTEQLLAAEEEIGIIGDKHEDLEIEHDALQSEYNALSGQLFEQYRGMLAAQEQRYLQGANAQHQGWTMETARLQAERDALQGDNERLVIACRTLQGQADQQTATVSRLKTVVTRQRRQLRQVEKQVRDYLTLTAASMDSAPRRAQRELPAPEDRSAPQQGAAKRKERREIEGHEPARLQSGSLLKVAGALVAGGVTAKLAIDGLNFSRSQKSLADPEKRPRLPGRVDKPRSDSED